MVFSDLLISSFLAMFCVSVENLQAELYTKKRAKAFPRVGSVVNTRITKYPAKEMKLLQSDAKTFNIEAHDAYAVVIAKA